MIAGKDYSNDFDTASDDHKPRILAAAIVLRKQFNKDDDDPDFDSGDETIYQEIFTQIP
jgi:hypothetical protein